MGEFWIIPTVDMAYTRLQNYTNMVVGKHGIQTFKVVVPSIRSDQRMNGADLEYVQTVLCGFDSVFRVYDKIIRGELLKRMDQVHCAAYVGNYGDLIEGLNCNKRNLL